MVTTFLSLLPTAYAALISNSVTLLSDFLRCLAEFLAILISWLVLRKIASSDQSSFNYGFGKLEQFASVLVAFALFTTFLIALFVGFYRSIYPVALENSLFGFCFAILSVAGNSFLFVKNYRCWLKDPSPILGAQWRLFRAKTMATVVVSVTLGVGLVYPDQYWSYYLDPIGSFVLSIFLFVSAYHMISHSMSDLLDRSVDESIQLKILSSLIKYEGQYVNLERIRSRYSGNRIFIEICLSFFEDSAFKPVAKTLQVIKEDLEAMLPGTEVLIVPVVYQRASNN